MPKSTRNPDNVIRDLIDYIQDEIKETADNDEQFKTSAFKRSVDKDRLTKVVAYNHGKHEALQSMLYHIKREFNVERLG